jgi:anti-anti-sigma factor
MFEIRTKNGENSITIFLDGRLDVNSAAEADRRFTELSRQTESIVLDCAKLEYISSAGLRAIKRLRLGMKEKNGSLVVKNVNEETMEVFEMTGFAALLAFE